MGSRELCSYCVSVTLLRMRLFSWTAWTRDVQRPYWIQALGQVWYVRTYCPRGDATGPPGPLSPHMLVMPRVNCSTPVGSWSFRSLWTARPCRLSSWLYGPSRSL